MFFNLIKEIYRLRQELNRLLDNVFHSMKEINRLRRETNRFLSKGMLNIYWKVTIDTFSKLPLSGFKKFGTRSVLWSSNSCRYHWILKLLVVTCKSDVFQHNCVYLFYYFNFERTYDVLKSNSPCILLKKNIYFNKNQAEWKIETPTHSFREKNLMLQLI